MSAETVILLKYDDNTSQPSVRNYCRGGIILKTTGDAKLLMEWYSPTTKEFIIVANNSPSAEYYLYYIIDRQSLHCTTVDKYHYYIICYTVLLYTAESDTHAMVTVRVTGTRHLATRNNC